MQRDDDHGGTGGQGRGFAVAGAALPAPPLPPGLHIVATPIGRLDDVTLRALRTLAAADVIACEDTRVSRKLLAHYGIRTPLWTYHEHNAARMRPKLLERLAQGAAIALISDAGTPLLSDPGQALVAEAIAAGVGVSIVPGPAASIAALAVSGLPATPHLFLGFLPPREAAARRTLEPVLAAERAGLAPSLVFYEAPHRLAPTLALLAELLGPRPAAVVRELTKRFEEVRRGTLAELALHYAAHAARGEITLVIGPASETPPDRPAMPRMLRAALARMGMREAVAAVATATGLSKREVYRAALVLKSADQAGEQGIEPDQA